MYSIDVTLNSSMLNYEYFRRVASRERKYICFKQQFRFHRYNGCNRLKEHVVLIHRLAEKNLHNAALRCNESVAIRVPLCGSVFLRVPLFERGLTLICPWAAADRR